MPTYVVLYRFTEQGRKKIKSTVRRAAQIRRENQRRGFNVIGTYWTEGHYDLVSIVDAPNEQAMLSGLFNIAQAGNVSSETLRAHTDREMQRALSTPAGGRRRRTARKATGRKTARKATRRTTRKATGRKTARKAARRTTRKATRRTTRKAARRTTRKAAPRKAARRRTTRKAAPRKAARRTTRKAVRRPARRTARRR